MPQSPAIPSTLTYSVLGIGAAGLAGLATWALLPREQRVYELCRGWVDPQMPAKIRDIARPVEAITGLYGLGDYLAGIAWIESRGSPTAGSDVGNAARGLFGIRPNSARVADLGLPPSVLKDPRYAVALGTWYLHRCLPYADPGQLIDWRAVRRCWAYPHETDDVDDTQRDAKLARGLECAGVDPNFMYQTAITEDYQWPGIDAVLDAVGRPRAYA